MPLGVQKWRPNNKTITTDLKYKRISTFKNIIILNNNKFNPIPKIIFIINKNVKNKKKIKNLFININTFIIIFN